jgi:hypothetical protein
VFRSPLPALFLAIPLLLTPARAAHAADPPPTDLTAPFEMTLGHVFALHLHQALQTAADLDKWDAPMSTLYRPESRRIDVELLGARGSVDGAKKSMDRFREELLGLALIGANHMCGTNVTEEQVSVVYVDRKHWKEIIRYVNGKYTVPE